MLIVTFDSPFSTTCDFSTLLSVELHSARSDLGGHEELGGDSLHPIAANRRPSPHGHRMFEVVEDAADDAQLEQRSG
jgi:hypothetical protein